jgi:hypothetical protein
MTTPTNHAVTTLAQVIARDFWGEAWWADADDQQRRAVTAYEEDCARAVLASGLVVPAADLKTLAEKWATEANTGEAGYTYGDDYAEELRGLLPEEQS